MKITVNYEDMRNDVFVTTRFNTEVLAHNYVYDTEDFYPLYMVNKTKSGYNVLPEYVDALI